MHMAKGVSLESSRFNSIPEIDIKSGIEEWTEYLATGSIYPDYLNGVLDNPLTNISITDADDALAALSGESWGPNLTLLDPGTHEWNLHYGAAPFLSYLPLSSEEKTQDTSAITDGREAAFTDSKKESSKPLTKACFEEFKALVIGRRKAGKILKLRFWLGDALELSSNGSLPHGVYSSVDTSNLADNLGLLTLLVTCQPLLLPDMHAMLCTTSTKWSSSGAKTLIEYLKLALGDFDLRLAPTLLGLRLLTPVEFGREFPRSSLSSTL